MAEKKTAAKTAKHENIYAALSAFQGELKTMAKTGHVEFNTSKGVVKFDYTPLGEIMSTIYPLLSKHGLTVRHEIVRGGALGTKEGIEAILTHETYKAVEMQAEEVEEQIGTERDPKELKNRLTRKMTSTRIEGELRSGVVYINQGGEMKDVGSAITYARRYTLTMLLGISSEEDKDVELFEARAEAAMGFAYSKAKQGIQGAKTAAELEKATKVLQDDMKKLSAGKTGALGLDKLQYEDLLAMAEAKKAEVDGASQDNKTPGTLID